MRSLSAQEAKVLAASGGYQVRFRVKVFGPDSLWTDLSDFDGYDFCVGANYSEELDGVAQATLLLHREVTPYKSLAPLRTDVRANLLSGIYDPLVREGRIFTIETASIPRGVPVQSGDWREVFRGRIDEIDAGDEILKVTGRDLSADYQDKFIETEAAYSDDTTPVAVETIMGQILTAAGFSAGDLYTAVSPGWMIKKFMQRREPVMTALRALATQIGWALQYRWTGSAFQLAFFEPGRAATTPVYTFTADSYLSVPELSTSRIDVRNRWRVYYSNKATPDSAGQPTRTFVTAEDLTSQTKYGVRYASIGEDSASQIDTVTEAQRLADAALADTKDVLLAKSFEVPYLYAIQLEDLVRLTANSTHYNADQDLAVVKVSHTLSAEDATTSITVRGKPSLGPVYWLAREQRPGVARVSKLIGPDAPIGVTSASVTNGAVVSFTEAVNGRPADRYELHVSGSSGFTPSAATLKSVSSATRFDLTGLIAGATYYAKVVPVAEDGTVGTASAEQTVTPLYVSPANLPPLVDTSTLPPNADFEGHSDPAQPPDGWSMFAGTWNTNAVSSSDALTGAKAVKLPAVGGGALISAAFTVRPGEVYEIATFAKASSGGALGDMRLRFYDLSGSFLGSVGPTTINSLTTSYARYSYSATVPATAATGRLYIAGSVGPDVYFDCTSVRRITYSEVPWTLIGDGFVAQEPASALAAPAMGGSFSNAGGAYQGLSFRKDVAGRVWLRGTVSKTGTATVTILSMPVGYRPPATLRFTAVPSGLVEIDSTGAIVISGYPSATNISFDHISYSTT